MFRLWSPLAARIAGAFVVLLLGCASGWSAEIDDSRRELEEIRRRIGQTAKTLDEKRRAEKTTAADLERLENTLSRTSERVNAMSRRLATLERQMQSTAGEMGSTGARIEDLDQSVRKRLVALYKGGGNVGMQLLFSAGSPKQVGEDREYWSRIVRHDRALLDAYRRRWRSQGEELRQLTELRAEQRQLLASRQAERDQMRKAAQLKQELLARVRQDRQLLAGELNALKERAGRVNALLKRLETSRGSEPAVSSTRFAEQMGRLPWPVTGRVRIPFGPGRHPELGTSYQSQGIEIEVAGERGVAAVWPGRVAYASWFKGYGNLLILDHGEGYYTLYAQAAQINRAVGDQIERGEVIALTDSREGRLYFEVRKGGMPLDPSLWLAP